MAAAAAAVLDAVVDVFVGINISFFVCVLKQDRKKRIFVLLNYNPIIILNYYCNFLWENISERCLFCECNEKFCTLNVIMQVHGKHF